MKNNTKRKVRGPQLNETDIGRIANGPRPHWTDGTLYRQWRRCREGLGLPTRSITLAEMMRRRK